MSVFVLFVKEKQKSRKGKIGDEFMCVAVLYKKYPVH